ncbi:MAG: hypothetical protein Q9163_005986, partial [Psora crenata]
VFRIWLLPFYAAPVELTTVMRLREVSTPTTTTSSTASSSSNTKIGGDGSRGTSEIVDGIGVVGDIAQGITTRYLIQSQNDLYQVNEFVKFISWFGLLSWLVLLSQFVATGFCVLGAAAFWPVSWAEQRVAAGGGPEIKEGRRTRRLKDSVLMDAVNGVDGVGLSVE